MLKLTAAGIVILGCFSLYFPRPPAACPCGCLWDLPPKIWDCWNIDLL